MKIQNITDVEKFFKVVDQCKGTVELVSPEGDRINLKSKLAQYLSMATIFSNGYIKELDLVAHDKEDIERLIKYCLLYTSYMQIGCMCMLNDSLMKRVRTFIFRNLRIGMNPKMECIKLPYSFSNFAFHMCQKSLDCICLISS